MCYGEEIFATGWQANLMDDESSPENLEAQKRNKPGPLEKRAHIGSELLFRCVHILWNLLDAVTDGGFGNIAPIENLAAVQLSNHYCISY